jgi:hypothetical protein
MKLIFACILFIVIGLPKTSFAETEAQALARQIANPLAKLIQIPLEFSFDNGFGVDKQGERMLLNIKPVMPFSFNDNWNVISRTVLPIVSLSSLAPNNGSEFGLGDTVQSFFFSPKVVGDSGWIWGAGPVFILPTSTNDYTGMGELGAGLTAVALKQHGKSWTYGALVNYILDVNSNSPIETSLLQPFISYRTSSAITYSVNSEATFNGISNEWAVPIKLSINKVMRFGKLPVSVGAGIRYWLDSPAGTAEGWGVVASLNILLPK